MRLSEHYGSGQFGLSVEIFPPKSADGDAGLRQTLSDLAPFRPGYISCTYGAGGSTQLRTLEWCQEIQDKFGCTATAHFTCVGSTQGELVEWLRKAYAAGIRNIMALRGDAPQGQTEFQAVDGGLKYANELVSLIREHYPDMGIGVAGYPEKHPEAPSLEVDLANLKRKVDAGADAVVTQLFYDNTAYFRFREQAARLGISQPIVPGIMPITEFARIQRITSLCHAQLPPSLYSRLEAVKDDKAAQFQIGVEFAISQCRELMDQGAPGIHFYVLNRSDASRQIFEALGFEAQPVVGA